MANVTLSRAASCAACHCKTAWGALLLCLVMFVLLSMFNIPFRKAYAPSGDDIPALAEPRWVIPVSLSFLLSLLGLIRQFCMTPVRNVCLPLVLNAERDVICNIR
jgi:hypothetical protein